ncbi:hypothetical protein ABPG77_007929 [Micractinium sp. CCAP 211/92]
MHPSPFEQHHNVPQPRVENLSLSRSNSGSRRGTLVGRGSEGAALQAPPLPLQPYGEHVSAQLRRRTLEARALLEEMQALAFVERRKAGLLAGWTWGTALLIQRLPGGAWSAPLFLRLRYGSVGLTLGGQRHRAVYTDEQVAGFARRAGTVAVDTAMPAELDPLDVHRELTASPEASRPQCATLGEGLIWDLSLRVGYTYLDGWLNSQLYGTGVTPDQVLGGQVPLPPELLPLYRDIEARASEAQVVRPALSKFELARRQSQQFAEWSSRSDRSVRGGEPSSRRGSLLARSWSGSISGARDASRHSGAARVGSISPASAGSGLLAGDSALEDSPVTTLAADGACSEKGGGFKLFADVADAEFEPMADTAGGAGGPEGAQAR